MLLRSKMHGPHDHHLWCQRGHVIEEHSKNAAEQESVGLGHVSSTNHGMYEGNV